MRSTSPLQPGQRDPFNDRRRGAVLVEGAVVLSVLLALVLGTIDLAVAVSRHNMVSQAARQGAREAIVHGRQAPPRRTAWGPAPYAGTAADDHEIAKAIRPALVGIDPQAASIQFEWPDKSNAVSKRVRCTVVTTYRPVLTSLFGGQELELTATSTMSIAH